MILPARIQEKLSEILQEIKPSMLKPVQRRLTEKYKTQSGTGKSLIGSKEDSILYAISRMPATFSVCLSLLNALKTQRLLENIESVIDVGSGTGAGYFALKEFDENIDISLFERDKNMIEVFDRFETGEKVQKFDLVCDELNTTADLVLTSYVLSELADEQRFAAAKKLYDSSNKYLLIVDTGTPKVWAQMMKLKSEFENLGAHIIAPCMSKKCMLENDYCQFFARVERTAVHRMVKEAELSYEDEKYFYLLVAKQPVNVKQRARVIRRPVLKTNIVSLLTCSSEGVKTSEFTRRDKELYKKAKKAKINDLI